MGEGRWVEWEGWGVWGGAKTKRWGGGGLLKQKASGQRETVVDQA